MIWKVIGALVYESFRQNAGPGLEVEERGAAGAGAGAELLLLLTQISASQAEPYRHVRVMRVLGFSAAQRGMFWWES